MCGLARTHSTVHHLVLAAHQVVWRIERNMTMWRRTPLHQCRRSRHVDRLKWSLGPKVRESNVQSKGLGVGKTPAANALSNNV
eukprot:5239311-Amphidinium_carterae.1